MGMPRPLLQGLRRHRRARAWSRWPNGQSWVCLIHRREEYRESRRHQDRDAKLLPRAHICAWERLNLQSCQKCQVNCQIVGGCFLFICQKKKYAKLRYQTLGDALSLHNPLCQGNMGCLKYVRQQQLFVYLFWNLNLTADQVSILHSTEIPVIPR